MRKSRYSVKFKNYIKKNIGRRFIYEEIEYTIIGILPDTSKIGKERIIVSTPSRTKGVRFNNSKQLTNSSSLITYNWIDFLSMQKMSLVKENNLK